MLSEPPQCRPVPVRALKGADSPRGLHRGHSPGHGSPPGARSTGGGWSLPASWPDPNSLRQLNPDHDETYRGIAPAPLIRATRSHLAPGPAPALANGRVFAVPGPVLSMVRARQAKGPSRNSEVSAQPPASWLQKGLDVQKAGARTQTFRTEVFARWLAGSATPVSPPQTRTGRFSLRP